jgi:hypothetical protein
VGSPWVRDLTPPRRLRSAPGALLWEQAWQRLQVSGVGFYISLETELDQKARWITLVARTVRKVL